VDRNVRYAVFYFANTKERYTEALKNVNARESKLNYFVLFQLLISIKDCIPESKEAVSP